MCSDSLNFEIPASLFTFILRPHWSHPYFKLSYLCFFRPRTTDCGGQAFDNRFKYLLWYGLYHCYYRYYWYYLALCLENVRKAYMSPYPHLNSFPKTTFVFFIYPMNFFSFPLHTIHPRHLAPSAKCYSAYWEGLCYGERKNECNSWKWFHNSRSIVGSNERQQTMLPVDDKKRSLFRRLHSRFFCKFPPILKYWWITIKMSWKIN